MSILGGGGHYKWYLFITTWTYIGTFYQIRIFGVSVKTRTLETVHNMVLV